MKIVTNDAKGNKIAGGNSDKDGTNNGAKTIQLCLLISVGLLFCNI